MKHVSAFIATLALILLGPLAAIGQMQQSVGQLTAKALSECQKGRVAKSRPLRLAHFERGKVLAEQALTLDEQHADAHFALFCSLGEKMRLDGESFSSVFAYSRLMAALDRTLALNPNHLDAVSSKGTFLIKLPRLLGGDPAEGERMLRRVVREDPNNCVNARLRLAEIQAAEGRHDEAIALATEALQVAQARQREDQIREANATLVQLRALQDGED
jgi:tetratricopeptide (TPR) repeat protein